MPDKMPKEHRLDIEGHKLFALEFNGDLPGTPAVFIHGIAASTSFWRAGQTPIFQERFRWFSLSLPGHYPAAFPPGFRPEALTADLLARQHVAAVRQLTGGAPALLAGHSTGGFAALNIAAAAPELARGVLSVAGFARGRWTGVLGLYQWLARQGKPGEALFRFNMRSTSRLGRGLYKAAVGFYAADRAAMYRNPAFDPTIDLIYPDAQRLDVEALLAYFKRMPDIDISERLAHISAPVLCVTGDSDPIVPPEQSRLIANGVQQGELVSLAGAGHMVMAERTAQYVEAVTRWVERVFPAGEGAAAALSGQIPGAGQRG